MSRQIQILFCIFAAGLLAESIALTQTTSVLQSAQPAQAGAQLQQSQAAQSPYSEEMDNLNKLAIDLKHEVDKSTKDQLSLSVVRKADAVEKLAHSLRQRIQSEGGVQ